MGLTNALRSNPNLDGRLSNMIEAVVSIFRLLSHLGLCDESTRRCDTMLPFFSSTMSTPNPLPLYTITPDAIIISTDVVSTDHIIAKLVEEAALNNFFGFNLEITLSKHVQLVQIATHERAYIFDINLLGGVSLVVHGSSEYEHCS